MHAEPVGIEGLLLCTPRVFGDERGFLFESYSHGAMARLGIACDFVQDNHSLSAPAGVVRGLHFQRPPFAQAKLVRCVRGSVYDVAVDIRPGSPTFGRHYACVLSAENKRMLFIPEGFAHGFATLEPMTEVLYKCSAPYHPANEAGVLWNDPALGIDWSVALPAGGPAPVLSAKDRALPRLSDIVASLGADKAGAGVPA